MSDQPKILWKSPCLDHETVRDGAERFVREVFGEERRVKWGKTPGEFRFADGVWCYLLSCEAGYWHVRRSENMTPQGKAVSQARRKHPPARQPGG